MTNPARVAQNPFLPFLRFQLSEIRPSARRWRRIKSRDISIASHRDSHIFAYYARELGAAYEDWLLRNQLGRSVLAFRPGSDSGGGLRAKCNIHFARHAFRQIRRMGSCQVIGADVRSFFDRIPHAVIKDQWAKTLGVHRLSDDHYAVFRNLTRYSWVDREAARVALGISKAAMIRDRPLPLTDPVGFRKVVRGGGLVHRNSLALGIPQGAPISATVSNIVMREFDLVVSERARSVGGFYLRYCDDILVAIQGTPNDANDFVTYLEDLLGTMLELQIAPEKTEVHSYSSGRLTRSGKQSWLQYLGFMFNGTRVLLRPKTLSRFHRRMESAVWLARASASKANRLRAQNGLPPTPLRKKGLYERYSHLGAGRKGRGNFVGYGLRAARIIGDEGLRRQVARQWGTLRRKLR